MTEREKEREQMVTTSAKVEYETLQAVHSASGDTLSYKFSYPDLSKSISVHYSSLLEFNGDRLSQKEFCQTLPIGCFCSPCTATRLCILRLLVGHPPFFLRLA